MPTPKVYRSRYPNHDLTLHLDNGERFPILFHNGEYPATEETMDKAGVPPDEVKVRLDDVQRHIEHLDSFGTIITIIPEDELKARAEKYKADQEALEEHREKAQAEADAKEKALKDAEKAKEAALKAAQDAELKRQAENQKMVSDIIAKENAKAKAAQKEADDKLAEAKRAQQAKEDQAILDAHEKEQAAKVAAADDD